MRIYVATKYENSKSAQEAYRALEADGHEITHDWTAENSEGLEGKVLTVYLDECAEHDVNGVLTCEGFLLLNHERIAGGFSEFGMAIAKKRLGHRMCIVTIGAFEKDLPNNIFFNLSDVHKAKDLSEARAIFLAFQRILDRDKQRHHG